MNVRERRMLTALTEGGQESLASVFCLPNLLNGLHKYKISRFAKDLQGFV